MLPVVDKPLIQYAVEEAMAAGITEMIFVTGRSKRAIEDHFDKSHEIEAELEARDKEKLLELVRGILPSHVTCMYVRQAEALGVGHAVLCAEKMAGGGSSAVVPADDLSDGQPPVLAQMVDVFDHYHSSVIGVEEIDRKDSKSYGVIEGKPWDDGLFKLSRVVEKPEPAFAPSNFGVVGRYVLMPRIFEFLRKQKPGTGNEIQLTDGIEALLKEEQVLAFRYRGQRFDCGSKLGYLKATVEFALRYPEVKDEFSDYLRAQFGVEEAEKVKESRRTTPWPTTRASARRSKFERRFLAGKAGGAQRCAPFVFVARVMRFACFLITCDGEVLAEVRLGILVHVVAREQFV